MAQHNRPPTTTHFYDNDNNNNPNIMLANSPFLFFQDEASTSPTNDSSSPYRLNSFDFSNTSQSVDDIFGIQSSSDDNPYMVSEIRMNDPLSQQNLFTGQENDSTLNPTFVHTNFLPEPSTPNYQGQADQRVSNNPRMLDLIIYHKPRGCKGIWQVVEKRSALRVTKGKGKWLKLEIKSPVPISAKLTELTLMEDNVKDAKTMLDTHRVVNDTLTIETISEYQKGGFWFVDTELKLDTVSKRLQFLASASTPSGNVTGYSVSFSGHNNGKANLSKAKDSANESTSPSSDDTPLVLHQNSRTEVIQSTSIFSDPSFEYRHKRLESKAAPPNMAPITNDPEPSQPLWSKRLKSEGYQQQPTVPVPYELPSETFPNAMYSIPSPPESPLIHQFIVPSPQDTYPIRPLASNANTSPSIPINQAPQATYPAEPRVNMAFGQGPTTVLSGPLEVHGSVRATSFIQFSDLRLKADVQDLLGAVDIISQLDGKSYTWKPDEADSLTGGRRVIGLIAQQVQKVLPEVVMEDPVTGYLSVSYTEIIPVLIEAFKGHMKTYQSDKDGILQQLNLLTAKMDELSAKRKTVATKFDFHIETGNTDGQGNPLTSRFLVHRPVLKQGIKFGSIVGFLTGLIMIIIGAITLGVLLAQPTEKTLIFVEEATDLQPLGTNSSVNPDPFCEVTAGTAYFRTKTIWDTKDPIWQQVFLATEEKDYIPHVNFMVKDDSKNYSAMPSRTMGYATFYLESGFPVNQLVNRKLPLTASANGQIVRGQLSASVLVELRKKPDWEIAFIVLGVFTTSISAILGSLVWMALPFPFLKKLYRGYVVAEDSM